LQIKAQYSYLQRAWIGLIGILILLLSSCSSQSEPAPGGDQAGAQTSVPAQQEPLPTATPQLDPKAIATGIGEATAATKTVNFSITLSGKAVYSDPNQTFVLLSVEGALERPDGILARLKVRSSGSVIEVRTVSLAGTQYFTNPINREWLCAAPGDLFDPAVLFDEKIGVVSLIRDRFENVSLVGIEDLGGRPHYRLRGTFPGEALRTISYNSLGAGPVQAEVWADQQTLRATQLLFVDTDTDPERPSTWQMNFRDYDQPVDIRAPISC
jgi:lipoprotein LprG